MQAVNQAMISGNLNIIETVIKMGADVRSQMTN